MADNEQIVKLSKSSIGLLVKAHELEQACNELVRQHHVVRQILQESHRLIESVKREYPGLTFKLERDPDPSPSEPQPRAD